MFQIHQHRYRLIALLFTFLATPLTVAQESQRAAGENAHMSYPETKKVDVVDDYHGRKVADPYRWLEDTESEETAAWIEAENEVTQQYLQSIPSRDEMHDRLQKFWNYERYTIPRRRGDTERRRYDGLIDESIVMRREKWGHQNKTFGAIGISECIRQPWILLWKYSA